MLRQILVCLLNLNQPESAHLCKSVERSDSVIHLQHFSVFLKIFYAAFVSYIKIKSQFPIFI